MDERIKKLKTPEECEQVAINAEERWPDLALAARRRAIELRAAAHEAESEAEREALEAVYAYERALQKLRGKRVRASRTWRMIEERGIIEAVERVVSRTSETAGYHALVELGMADKLFEAVVVRHPHVFSADAVAKARERLAHLMAQGCADSDDSDKS